VLLRALPGTAVLPAAAVAGQRRACRGWRRRSQRLQLSQCLRHTAHTCSPPHLRLLAPSSQVGLSLPFAKWLLPRIREHFPSFPDKPPEALYAAENVLKSPSLIRVEADEVGALA
jgi:hypothetical protein